MKKRNEGYLKTHTGRQVLWFSLALSAASLLVAGIALPLQVQSRRQLFAQVEDPPSDQFPDENHFLTFNSVIGALGPDNAVSACNYYKAIRAINPNKNCDRDANIGPYLPPDGKTFDAWKRENGLKPNPDSNGNRNPFDDDNATDPPEVTALFFNAVDLNLARSMHGRTSVVNGVKTTAYYVCNYKTLEQPRADPDNSNADTCVAFDYSADRPFTKFYVFNRDGNLDPAADLDKRGRKFVPGLCKTCHGGDKQRRQPFVVDPELDRLGRAGDIGAHFLPFDLDNFDYLEDSAFSRRAQESKFKRLNQMILETETDPTPVPVVKQLIDNWYLGGRTEQDSQFIPPGWKEGHEQLYRRVVKRSCRTCHVAMPPGFNFDTFGGFNNLRSQIKDRVCVDTGVIFPRSMPNSKVTFDLFWLDIVQRTVLVRFLRDALGDPRLQCPPP